MCLHSVIDLLSFSDYCFGVSNSRKHRKLSNILKTFTFVNVSWKEIPIFCFLSTDHQRMCAFLSLWGRTMKLLWSICNVKRNTKQAETAGWAEKNNWLRYFYFRYTYEPPSGVHFRFVATLRSTLAADHYLHHEPSLLRFCNILQAIVCACP